MNANQLKKIKNTMLGYPINCNTGWTKKNNSLMQVVLNNLGEPFSNGTYKLNTFSQERDVVHWFSELFNLPKEKAWGYVTNSGSESNLQGFYLGREKLKKKSSRSPIVYFSDKAHYSMKKAANILGLQTKIISTKHSDAICVDDLIDKIDTWAPSIIGLTVGTTMSGAIDEVAKISKILTEYGPPTFLHIDAALSGLQLPFIEGAPIFDFRLPIDSICVSGHKMLGNPIPCSIFVTKHKPECESIEYINSHCSTICGSRDGISSYLLLQSIKKHGKVGLKKIVEKCLNLTYYARNKLMKYGLDSWRNDFSNIIVLPSPSTKLIERWQLARDNGYCHIVVMPHVTKKMIDLFIEDLRNEQTPSCSPWLAR